ncbi:MAG: hypothetical protein WC789_02930 [Lentisphaeria bacterium]|jgi:hypothetical protein
MFISKIRNRNGDASMSQTLQLHPKFVTDNQGKRKAVILQIREYEELLEDFHDLAVVAERRDEPTITHTQLVRELNQNGILHR